MSAAVDLTDFERLVRRWQPAVCAIALARTRDVAASEDVAQDVFLTAWTRLSTLRDPASFGPWVRQLARHKASNHERAAGRRAARVTLTDQPVDGVAPVMDPLEEAEKQRVLDEALDALPDDARDAMVLFYREGQRIGHIAELLGVSEAAVKKRLSRARQTVRADVLARFEAVVKGTAPSAALTAMIVAGVAPSTAAAGTVVLTRAATTTLWGAAWASVIAVVGVVLGYRFAERLVPTEQLPQVHRARNLTVVALLLPIVGLSMGMGGLWVAMAACFLLLGYVQLVVLPRAFALASDATQRQHKWARLGAFCGIVGWLVGGLCAVWGLLH